jgi:hypothetical protein
MVMFNKLSALALLLLVVSPATAPFQTVDLPPLSVNIVTPDSPPDVAVATQVPEASRTRAAPAHVAIIATHVIALPSIWFVGGSLSRPGSIASRSQRSTILRV